MEKSKTCKRLIKGNRHCKCKVMKDSEFCYWHNPEIPENEKQETRSRGGKSPKRTKYPYTGLTKVTIASDEDIPQAIVEIMNDYRAGIISDKTAQTLGNLCGVLVKAYAQKNSKQIEEILEKLETAENQNPYRQTA